LPRCGSAFIKCHAKSSLVRVRVRVRVRVGVGVGVRARARVGVRVGIHEVPREELLG